MYKLLSSKAKQNVVDQNSWPDTCLEESSNNIPKAINLIHKVNQGADPSHE